MSTSITNNVTYNYVIDQNDTSSYYTTSATNAGTVTITSCGNIPAYSIVSGPIAPISTGSWGHTSYPTYQTSRPELVNDIASLHNRLDAIKPDTLWMMPASGKVVKIIKETTIASESDNEYSRLYKRRWNVQVVYDRTVRTDDDNISDNNIHAIDYWGASQLAQFDAVTLGRMWDDLRCLTKHFEEQYNNEKDG